MLQLVSYFSLRVALPVPSWRGLFSYWLIYLFKMSGFGCRFAGWMMVYHVIVTAVVGDGFPPGLPGGMRPSIGKSIGGLYVMARY